MLKTNRSHLRCTKIVDSSMVGKPHLPIPVTQFLVTLSLVAQSSAIAQSEYYEAVYAQSSPNKALILEASPRKPVISDSTVVTERRESTKKTQKHTFESEAPTSINSNSQSIGSIRIAREDWVTAAREVSGSREWRDWLDGQKRSLDRWIASNRERPDLISGWRHDYIDGTTGAPLKWLENSPEPLTANNDSGRKLREAWNAHMRHNNISHALTAARLFRISGDRKYSDWAKLQLDFYADNYLKWPVRTLSGRSNMFSQGLDEAYSVFDLLEVARLLEADTGANQSANWKNKLFYPIAENLKIVKYRGTNHALWHASAIAAIAMRHRDQELLKFALESPQGIRSTAKLAIGEDGIWYEGSMGYNEYVLDCYSKLLNTASLEGYSTDLAAEWDEAKRLLNGPLSLRFDNGDVPTPGDATGRISTKDYRPFLLLFRVLSTSFGRAAAGRSKSWSALLDNPGTELPYDQLPVVKTKNLSSVRMAVLRSGDWQAFVHYGQSVASHSQEEALTFELHHSTTPISTDSGTVLYSSPLHKDYFRRGAAHNVPLIDGYGQQKWGRGDVDLFDLEESRLTVSHPKYRDDVMVRRSFQVTTKSFIESTAITLTEAADKPRKLGSAFHTKCAIVQLKGIIPDQRGGTLPKSMATSYWQVSRALTAGRSWTATLDCGAAVFDMKIDASGDQTVYVASGPTTPLPQRENILYYEILGNSASFTTTLSKTSR